MKKLLSIAVIALAPLAFSTQAAMTVQMENALIAVCKAGASNNVVKFNGTMREYRINKQRIFPRLVCNQQSFYQFAQSQGAERTAQQILRYTKGSVTITDIAMHYEDMQPLTVNY